MHEERWRICVTDVDNVLGFAVGAMFVNRTFDGKSKPEAETMIKGVSMMRRVARFGLGPKIQIWSFL